MWKKVLQDGNVHLTNFFFVPFEGQNFFTGFGYNTWKETGIVTDRFHKKPPSWNQAVALDGYGGGGEGEQARPSWVV